MPSDEYYLEVADPEIGKLDVDTSIVTAKKLGHTSIRLKDKNAKESEPKPQLTAGIHVVEPSYMRMSFILCRSKIQLVTSCLSVLSSVSRCTW